jgi:hypothetical protein
VVAVCGCLWLCAVDVCGGCVLLSVVAVWWQYNYGCVWLCVVAVRWLGVDVCGCVCLDVCGGCVCLSVVDVCGG